MILDSITDQIVVNDIVFKKKNFKRFTCVSLFICAIQLKFSSETFLSNESHYSFKFLRILNTLSKCTHCRAGGGVQILFVL